jgi:DNA-binding FadR family transcriptional regulator
MSELAIADADGPDATSTVADATRLVAVEPGTIDDGPVDEPGATTESATTAADVGSAGRRSHGRAAAGAWSGHGGTSVWRPVRGGNAFEITVARLAQAIRLGMVATGDQLPPERELAERLQVSRVTLREAIAALRDAGYLETRRGRAGGTFVVYRDDALPVAGPDEAAALAREMGDKLHDALDFRRVVEPGAAALAATRSLSAAERAHLTACLAAAADRRAADRRVADSRLHLAIATAGGSPSLAAAVADVQVTVDRLLALIPVLERNLEHSDAQHRRIVEAILSGDPRGARTAMEEHCDGTAELLRGLLT